MMSGADLKAWRRAIGWTQSDLMEELGITSRQTVAGWERAARLPRLVELAVIALDQNEACRNRSGFEKQFSAVSIANTHFALHKEFAAIAENEQSAMAPDRHSGVCERKSKGRSAYAK